MLTTAQLFWILFIPSLNILVTIQCYINLKKEIKRLTGDDNRGKI